MKINKKNVRRIGFLIVFSVLYILLAVKPSKNSLQFVPQWTIDIDSNVTGTATSEVFPYKLGNYMGYFTPDGLISSLQMMGEKGSVSSHYIAPYTSDAQQTTFFNSRGEQSGIIQEAGFPFFDENRIFLFYPTGNAFSVYSSTGEKKWTYENYVPITAFSSNEKGIIAGYADGKILVFNLDGAIVQDFYPGGSEYEIIFGAALSESGRYAACLSGLDRQRIVVSDIAGNNNKIIFHTYIENAVLDQSLVYFSKNEKYVFVNSKNALVAIDIDEKTEQIIPIEGKIITVKEIYQGKYYLVLSKNRDKSTVSIYNKNLYEVGSFSFDENNAFLDTDNEHMYIGNGTTISKVLVKEESRF